MIKKASERKFLNDFPSWQDSGAYFDRSLRQLILGNFSDDVTGLGTISQIATGILDINLPGDIRDLVYDIKNWEWSWGHAGQTGLDALCLFPIIGVLKYTDEAGTLLKHTDEAADALKETGKLIEAGTDVFKRFNIDNAFVKPKHLSTSTGKARKFLGATKSEAEEILKREMNNGKVVDVLDNGVSELGNQKYRIILDAGETIGTKGETLIRIILSDDGGMLSAFPTK